MDRERLLTYLDERYASKRDLISRIPLGVKPDELWQELVSRRRAKSVTLPLIGNQGVPLWYVVTDRMVAASEKIVEALYSEGVDVDPYSGPVQVSALEEVFFTGYVEGMQMTLREAMEFLAGDKLPRDIEEQLVYNNRMASAYAGSNLFRPIDASVLTELAEILTDGVEDGGPDYRSAPEAEFSPSPGERFPYPPPETIPKRVEEIITFLASPDVHPLIKAGTAQIWMMTVRPFREGNDRLGRVLSSVILLRAGYSFFGDVSLSALIARKSYEYYNAVANVLRSDSQGDITYFLDHYLELLSRAIDERRLQMTRRTEQTMVAEREIARQPLERREEPEPEDTGHPEPDADLADFHGFHVASATETGEARPLSEVVAKLKQYALGPARVLAGFAGFLLDRIEAGDAAFSVSDVGAAIGVNSRGLSTCIRLLKKDGIIAPSPDPYVKGRYFIVYESDGEQMPEIAGSTVSPSVFKLINELAESTLSPKDRRVAAMLKAHMDKGEITIEDYVERGEEKRWPDDMSFAMQLGLVERITYHRYRILKSLKSGRKYMSRHQKKFISDVYESFGTESFSREMIIANLDYSGTNVSAYLHKFTLMRIMNCRRNGLLFQYQLLVNPKDHPECFADAA